MERFFFDDWKYKGKICKVLPEAFETTIRFVFRLTSCKNEKSQDRNSPHH